ncbi:MAG: hypothetical protein JOZ13_10010 [Alphaproteobacteria bacterium]|nr:hypothetical protein [Alphaproteobacteria bacterium]
MIRDFPYPFASALAIVSDADGSSKARYEGYVGDIVRKHGLDFGDSTWLRTSCATAVEGMPIASGMGFLSHHFGTGSDLALRTFARVRTLSESIAEYHVGNLDHFHSFSSTGPRVAILSPEQMTGGGGEFELWPCEKKGFWRCDDVYIDAVCVVVRGDAAVDHVVIKDREARTFDFARQVGAPSGNESERRLVFVAFQSADANFRHPRLDEIELVRVSFGGAVRESQIARVLLISGSSAILFDRLRFLCDRYGVEMSLVTEHSGLHYRSTGMASRRDNLQDQHIAENPAVTSALNGTRRTERDGIVLSTDADDPASYARVLPELIEDFEARFFVPVAARSTSGLAIGHVVQPMATRAGATVYHANRVLPNITDQADPRAFDGTFSWQDNFEDRLEKALKHSLEIPGLYWPIYTHLGAISAPVADNDLPSPYFAGDALRQLQDHTFDISETVAPEARIWTARASSLYDYALIRKSIVDHVVWTDPNTVRIESWHDAVLLKTLPRSPAQLYGLTFYVKDPAAAKVFLDNQPIHALARNPADETGEPSVTILESEIRHAVFDALDPMQRAGAGAALEEGGWRFSAAKRPTPSFGRLTASSGKIASLEIPMCGWRAEGTQLLSFLGRRGKGADMGITLETESGGRFFFGDSALLDEVGPLSAHYTFEYDRSTNWRTMVAPFHCMTWAKGSAPGGPMPSHPLSAIKLICAGGASAFADFAQLSLLRPRATALNHREVQSYCLGGRVIDFRPDQTVQARLKGRRNTIATNVDQRGWFCFPNMVPGIYTVWSEGQNGALHDRRGAQIELISHCMTLQLGKGT